MKHLGRLLCATLVLLFAANHSSWAQSFTLTATPQTLTIHPGDQNVPVTIAASSATYAGPINVTLTGLPSGISVPPISLSAGSTGTLLLSAAVNADQEGFQHGYTSTNIDSPVYMVTVAGAVGSDIETTTFALTVSISNVGYAPDPGKINLPIVRIDTGGTPIQNKTTTVPGTVTITSSDGQTSYLPNSSASDNTAGFHYHGNSSLLMPKKSYHVKLNTSLDLLSAMGLVCPYVAKGKPVCDKSKSYDLLANYDDKTFVRDWAASALANAIPMGGDYLTSPPGSPSPSGTSTLMPWAPHSLFVELYINGKYQGNYQLIEEVKADSHRLNISELAETDTTDDITGGYLLEFDQHQDEAYVFRDPTNLPIGLDDPDFTPDPEVPQQTAYISSYVDTAVTALISSTFTDPTVGWRAYFDEASAVNFYIVNDLMGNEDGGDFYSSDYFYKDLDNPLLYMGPIWDFDISSGNTNGHAIVNPTVPWMQEKANWYRQWFKDPGFKADVTTQWNALKNNGVLSNWLASVGAQAASLEQTQANNFGRWPMQGLLVWPNAEAAGSYDGEVAYMTEWLTLRMAYLDSQFNNKAPTATTFSVSAGSLRNGLPATLTAHVTGATTPTGTVSFLSTGVLLGTAQLDGAGNANFTTTALPAGTDVLEAVYNGDSTYGLSASTPQTVTVLNPFVSTVTNFASSTSSASSSGDIAFTVSVLGNSGTIPPTGTVTFTANGNVVGTASLTAAATASFSTPNLPGGSDLVQASYSGDVNYDGSSSLTLAISLPIPPVPTPTFTPAGGTYTSVQSVAITDSAAGSAIYYTTDGSTPSASSTLYAGPITVTSTQTINAIALLSGSPDSAVGSATYTINLPPPAFTLALSTASATIQKGQSATFTVTVTPNDYISDPVSLSCSGLPAGETCTFSPTTVNVISGPATSTVTISGSGNSARLASEPLSGWKEISGGIVLALLIWPFRKRQKLFACLLFVGVGLAVWGCGGSKPTTSTVTVTATVDSISESQTIALTVQH